MFYFLPFILLLLLLLNLPFCMGTVTLVETGEQYASFQDSRFKLLAYGVEYRARLQRSMKDPTLCHDVDILIPEGDSTIVAVIAQSGGGCSIIDKARMVSNIIYKPNVIRFLIIYGAAPDNNNDDNNDDENNRAIDTMLMDPKTMADLSPSLLHRFTNTTITTAAVDKNLLRSTRRIRLDDIDIVVLYVSYHSAASLISAMENQSEKSYQEGGPLVLLDGFQGWVPGYDGYDSATLLDVVIITTLCFLCCLSLTCVFGNNMQRLVGGVVVVEPGDEERRLPGRYRHGLRLLNREEVECLPEVEFVLDNVLNGTSAGIDLGGDGGRGASPVREKQSQVVRDEVTDNLSQYPARPILSNRGGEEGHDENCDDSATCTGLGNEHFQDITCTICLEDYQDGEKLRILPCQHAFHSECIIPWLTDRAPTCPLCKALLEVRREEDHEMSSDDGSHVVGDEGDNGQATVEEPTTVDREIHWYSAILRFFASTEESLIENPSLTRENEVGNNREEGRNDLNGRVMTSRSDSMYSLLSRLVNRQRRIASNEALPSADVELHLSLSPNESMREPLLLGDFNSDDSQRNRLNEETTDRHDSENV
mmetsp:Transcript_14900/g.28033  ORF Transcript_14900/g.28033 Transcript_14900/m.28033 type:complete len:593 (-) Transcript_14900:606-2384(-)